MKRIVLAVLASLVLGGTASAADMAVKARPVAPPAVFSWTGFYIGAHAGGDWFDKNWFGPASAINIASGCIACPAPAGGHSGSSWLAGGQIGFNYQTGMWVLGVEADGSWTNLSARNVNLGNIFIYDRSKTDAVVTFAGRVGVAANQALFYVKGGGAVANDRFSTGLNATGVEGQTTSDTRWGWMAGVGIEYAFTSNWSVKAEYNYLDFGTQRQTLQPTGLVPGVVPFQYDIRQRMDLVKFGFNYRFGGASAVVAKY